jgi:hypothetical protein
VGHDGGSLLGDHCFTLTVTGPRPRELRAGHLERGEAEESDRTLES